MDISVVIPAYNEASVLAATLADVRGYLQKTFSSFEVIVVDDGSSDATASIARQFANVRCVEYGGNRGKGFAVKTGVLASSGEYILFMDADNSTNIRELDHCMKEIEHYDIVIGSRAVQHAKVITHQPLLKRTLGRVGNRIIRTILALPIQDTQCGFKLFRSATKRLFELQTIDRWGFDFEILFLAKCLGYRIFETPVRWTNNFDTKVSPWSYVTTFWEVIIIRIRHLRLKTNTTL